MYFFVIRPLHSPNVRQCTGWRCPLVWVTKEHPIEAMEHCVDDVRSRGELWTFAHYCSSYSFLNLLGITTVETQLHWPTDKLSRGEPNDTISAYSPPYTLCVIHSEVSGSSSWSMLCNISTEYMILLLSWACINERLLNTTAVQRDEYYLFQLSRYSEHHYQKRTKWVTSKYKGTNYPFATSPESIPMKRAEAEDPVESDRITFDKYRSSTTWADLLSDEIISNSR